MGLLGAKAGKQAQHCVAKAHLLPPLFMAGSLMPAELT